MRELWEPIEGTTGTTVSNLGRVKNTKTREIHNLRQNQYGTSMVTFYAGRYQVTRSVAYLVGRAFVEAEPRVLAEALIHLNGDKLDCRAINLKWRSLSFARRYSRMFDQEPLRVAVLVMETGERFGSLREFCVKYGIPEGMAYVALNNKEPTFPYQFTLERWTH